ncbi:ferredoxin-NADPH reductase [Isoptericola sp. NPDC019693]|uniref:ferredoxin-NADPH reductase n=1 Tax=Isoptericola sp. NPDC019693 TaxID=3364009 RepID=UPI003788110E
MRARTLLSHATLTTVFEFAYVVLATNGLLALSSLPLLVLLVTTDPLASWPALAVALALAFPGVAAAMTVFREFSAQGRIGVVRTYLRALRDSGVRAAALGAIVGAVGVVVVVDAVGLWGQRLGAVVIPVLVVLVALTLVCAPVALVLVVDRPGLGWRAVLSATFYLGVRRWYLGALSVVSLLTLAGAFALRPALAVGVLAAPLLYVVWANSRHVVRSADREPPVRNRDGGLIVDA